MLPEMIAHDPRTALAAVALHALILKGDGRSRRQVIAEAVEWAEGLLERLTVDTVPVDALHLGEELPSF